MNGGHQVFHKSKFSTGSHSADAEALTGADAIETPDSGAKKPSKPQRGGGKGGSAPPPAVAATPQ
eukprot:4629445-Amphidinium_carterae.1